MSFPFEFSFHNLTPSLMLSFWLHCSSLLQLQCLAWSDFYRLYRVNIMYFVHADSKAFGSHVIPPQMVVLPQLPEKCKLKPIKFRILGAAQIAPPVLIFPAKSHPEVEVYTIAAWDEGRATMFGKKFGIKKVYGGRNEYQGVQSLSEFLKNYSEIVFCRTSALLDDPDVDIIYNSVSFWMSL